jgi:hypothetical protein
MRYFLWKIAGADCEILEKSGRDSQYSFYIIGVLYIIVTFLTFLGFFGLFWGVFRSQTIIHPNGIEYRQGYPFFSALIGGSVLGFLVSNIYRLNLISLEPNTLPVKKEDSSLFFTNFIRYSTIVLFAFFVSKNIEMEVVNILESAGIFPFDLREFYMNHMLRMNREQPWVWVITGLIILVFIAPIYLRHRLNRAHEYYILKRIRDKELVKNDYKKAKIIKEDLLRNLYKEYQKVNISKTYNIPVSRYSDEPFNTKEIIIERKLNSSEDFLEAIINKS